MKTIKIFFLLIFIFIFNFCKKNNDNEPDDVIPPCFWGYSYQLFQISFMDTSGNDLIKGIDYECWSYDSIPKEEGRPGVVKENLYSLNLVYPNPLMNPYKDPVEDYKLYGTVTDKPVHKLYFRKMCETGVFSLHFQLGSNVGYIEREYPYKRRMLPSADKIIIKLKCPYIFNDEIEHEIVVYWKPYKNCENNRDINKDCDGCVQPYCNVEFQRIEFDGKEIKAVGCCENEYLSSIINVFIILDNSKK